MQIKAVRFDYRSDSTAIDAIDRRALTAFKKQVLRIQCHRSLLQFLRIR
jgi:hypothetical protein